MADVHWGYDAIEVKSCFADLVAVVQVTEEPRISLLFYHASLADYLRDQSQSGLYHVDVAAIAAELSLICLSTFDDESEPFDYPHSNPTA